MTVLVLRPSPSGEALVKLLKEHGINSWHTPLIRLAEGQEIEQVPEKLSRLQSGDLLFAVSQNAVNYADRVLSKNHISWPDNIQYFAIGRTTANALRSATNRPVNYPKDREISEHLLQLSELHNIKRKNALILRGNGGRELLAEQLKLRGASVDICQCYQRIPISYHSAELIAVWREQDISTIIVTSAEILQRIYSLIEDQALIKEHDRGWLLNHRLIVVSERIALLAKQLGWSNVKIADNADNHSLLTALK